MTESFDRLKARKDQIEQREHVSLVESFNGEINRIKEILPDVTNQMTSDFMKLHDTRLYTVRIWAEQGVLVVRDGAIYKVPAPAMTKEQIDTCVNAIKKLSVFRCGAIFKFQPGSFSASWTDDRWILSFIHVAEDTAFLSKERTEAKPQPMSMEVLYTAWLNASAVIEGYEDSWE